MIPIPVIVPVMSMLVFMLILFPVRGIVIRIVRSMGITPANGKCQEHSHKRNNQTLRFHSTSFLIVE
jgi:hypothetical protein